MARRRTRGSGSVFYDHSARSWVALLSMGSRDGKRVRRKVRAATEREARQELEQLNRLYRSGGNPSTATLDAYLRRWLEDHKPNIAKSTHSTYGIHVRRHISPLLGGIMLGRLQAQDVRRLIADRLAAGQSPSSVGHIVTTLRIALRQAVEERVIPDNVASHVKLPRVHREPIRALTREDIRRIRDAVRGDELEALYVLLMGTGMRVGEACNLDWRDVDLEAGTVFIREGKTARAIRTLHLSAPVVAMLRNHRVKSIRVGQREPVFLGPRSGERLQRWTVAHAFPRILKRAGLPHMRVHDIRHGFATRAAQSGVSILTLSGVMGHANPTITHNIYAHAIPADQATATDLVGSELA